MIYEVWDLINSYRFADWDIGDKKKSLLLVSKTIGLEALDVLYGENIFHLSVYQAADSAWRTYSNGRRIRMIQVLMHPPDSFFGRKLEPTIFPPILANLKKLTIVAQQPLEARRFHDTKFRRDMQEWVEWLRGILQCVGGQLPNSCIVEVDNDDRRETSTVMRECFPSGYRKVQTEVGDEHFMR